jgi:GT2 family glycosyltransferase
MINQSSPGLISVVIPTCNRNDLLRLCLDKLSSSLQFLSSACYEVIVTDDSKENVAKDIIEGYYNWVQWIEGPKRGPAANRNHGARKAKGEWLLFIDDDCLPSAQILNEYYVAIKDKGEIFVFEGCIKPDRPKRSFKEEAPINETGGYLWSCNIMIQKRIFFEVLYGFDENFPYAAMEDVDLCYRINKAKIAHVFLKHAYVIHPWRIQTNPYSATIKRFKSTLYYLKKHPEKSAEINSLYYLKAFYNGFIKDLVRNSSRYRSHGLLSKLITGVLNLYFSAYLLVTKRNSG